MKEDDGKLTDIRHDDEAEKDIGVLFDRKMLFRQHIGSIVKKVNRMIGLTRHTFHYMDEEVLRLLYTSLMRPHMEYADWIWSPHLKVDIAQLENAQRRVTRLVPELRDRCYEDCLRALNLPRLLYRRRLMDMIQTFSVSRRALTIWKQVTSSQWIQEKPVAIEWKSWSNQAGWTKAIVRPHLE